VGYKNRENKKQKFSQHKVIMIGDSFLRRIREIVELSISNKFGIYSLLKPGCKLNTLLESANGASGSLAHKDLIFICGGANDFNYDTELTTGHIQEFIKSNKHTDIVLANVPLRYDLSYHSQVNKRIRSYNKKLLEIIKDHKQVAQIKIDIDRKYHTRHGLHLNKLGKLLFSNKITQTIYSTLGKKLEQSSLASNMQGIQGGENKVDERNSNKGRINKKKKK
jgi:hypothetical protein